MTEPGVHEQGADPAKVVVGIVGSAAAVGSLEHLLRTLPRQESAAIVVVLQHREALDEEQFKRT